MTFKYDPGGPVWVVGPWKPWNAAWRYRDRILAHCCRGCAFDWTVQWAAGWCFMVLQQKLLQQSNNTTGSGFDTLSFSAASCDGQHFWTHCRGNTLSTREGTETLLFSPASFYSLNLLNINYCMKPICSSTSSYCPYQDDWLTELTSPAVTTSIGTNWYH